jgi:hypothetical protein
MHGAISVAEQMHTEDEKDNVVHHVHQDGVACRTSCTANVSSGNPSQEGIGEHNRVDVHCRKERGMYEERRNEAHVPIQPREQESSKEDLLKERDEQTATKNRDPPGGRTLALETFRVSRHSG